MALRKFSHAGCGYSGPDLLDGLCPECMAETNGVTVQEMVTAAKTAEIIDWVCNDRPVHARLIEIISGRDGYRGRRADAAPGSGTARMADFIEHIIVKDDGSTYRSMHREFTRTHPGEGGGYDSTLPTGVRERMGDYAWLVVKNGETVQPDAVDWDAVRAAVMRGEE